MKNVKEVTCKQARNSKYIKCSTAVTNGKNLKKIGTEAVSGCKKVKKIKNLFKSKTGYKKTMKIKK